MTSIKSKWTLSCWGATAAAVILLSITAGAQAMSQRSEVPTAAQIERFLRSAQQEAHPRLPPAYWNTKLLDFELRQLEATAPSNWIAVAKLSFDFGPPPVGVIGFERERGGEFRLVLERKAGEFGLKRFAPLRGVRPLLAR